MGAARPPQSRVRTDRGPGPRHAHRTARRGDTCGPGQRWPDPWMPPRRQSKARSVLEHLGTQGASFFDEIVEACGLLPSQAEEGLAELVGLGLVNSDSFGGLRALLVPSDRRRSSTGPAPPSPRALRHGFGRALGAGAARAKCRHQRPHGPETIELVARGLLRRWGVVFWRLLAREADWLPPWRELLSAIAASRRAARSAAAASSPGCRASSSPRPKRWDSCGRCAAARARGNGCRSPRRIRSTCSES